MKKILRLLFSPLLKTFEAGSEAYAYKPSHRTILLTMSAAFLALSGFVFTLIQDNDQGYILPVIFFGIAGLIGLVVGTCLLYTSPSPRDS